MLSKEKIVQVWLSSFLSVKEKIANNHLIATKMPQGTEVD
jgi:hypothetical protein